MDAQGTREMLIATARSLIVNDFDHFSVAAVCRETGLSRSKVRSHFSTKASLVGAVFGEGPPTSRQRLLQPKEPIGNDWIERRFRVCERALSLLETRTDAAADGRSHAISLVEEILSEPFVEEQEPEELPPIVRPPEVQDHLRAEQALAEEDLPPIIQAPTKNDSGNGVCADETLTTETGAVPQLTLAPGDELHRTTTPNARKVMQEIFENARLSENSAAPTESGTLSKLTPTVMLIGSAAFALVLLAAGIVGVRNSHPAAQTEAFKPGQAHHTIASVRTIDATGRTASPGYVQSQVALRGISALAEKGDARAQAALALAFLRGDGVSADPLTAGRWSQVAAARGEPTAQYILGSLYGEGIKPNPVLAFRWFSAAATRGNVKAMHNVAVALMTGTGVSRDAVAAASWFSKAAYRGYRDSAFDLAVLYERGEGVAQSQAEALRWYDAAAASGDAEASKRAAVLRSGSL
jgi:AcrR family transcriptional regulator